MPDQRFFNLKPEKRERVLNRCLEEFADRNFRQASVSRIVEDLEIAKGSLYQYFGSKRGLYDYLIKYSSETKLEHLKKKINWENPDFGELLVEMFLEGFQFDLKYPLLSRFIVQTNQAGNDDFPKSSAVRMRRNALDFMVDLVQQAQSRGRVREDVSPESIALVLHLAATQFGLYFADSKASSLKDLLEDAGKSSLLQVEIKSRLKEITRFLRTGFLPGKT